MLAVGFDGHLSISSHASVFVIVCVGVYMYVYVYVCIDAYEHVS